VGTLKLTVAYDGTEYSGWARQPGLRTVEETLEGAIGQILGGREVSLTVAGRTDAGVHAAAQVVSLRLDADPPDRMARRINAVLPRDVAVVSCELAPEGFDARRWATSRSYRYRLLLSEQRDPFEEGRALWLPRPPDRAALDACAEAIAGEHDFTAFTPTQTKHVRFARIVRTARWVPEDDGRLLVFEITADAFMRSMIRVLVGTMLEVAYERRSLENLTALLEGAPREQAGETAPARGLFFTGVTFGDGPAYVYPDETGSDTELTE
jgi:tRNA pseudouridine38-40 synthase